MCPSLNPSANIQMALQGAGDPIQAQQALVTNPLTRAAYSPRAQGLPLPGQGMAVALPLPAGLDTRSPLEQAFDPKTPLTAAIDGRSFTASMASIDARPPMPGPGGMAISPLLSRAAAGMSFRKAILA